VGDGAAWSTGTLSQQSQDNGVRGAPMFVLCSTQLRAEGQDQKKNKRRSNVLIARPRCTCLKLAPQGTDRPTRTLTLALGKHSARKFPGTPLRGHVPLPSVSLMLCRKKMGLLYTLHSP
jgi:hypothetical protein